MKKIKVCIIGCGMIARSAHIPAYLANGGFEIAAVCDNIESSAKGVCDKFGIARYYTDATQMLETEKPEVVSVCAPNMMHKKYVMSALEHGANVLCEKPLALTLCDAEEMFLTAKKNNRILMACQTLRFLPERLAVEKMKLQGEIGDIYYAELSRIRRRGIPTWGKFHIKEFSGGGALIDIGVHGIDSAIWLMGNPKPISVSAIMNKAHTDELGNSEQSGALKGGVESSGFNPEEMNVESFAAGNVRFENGSELSFKVAWAANLPEQNNIIIVGNKKGVDTENRKVFYGSDTVDELLFEPNGFKTEPFFGHFCIADNLYNCLSGAEEPFVKPEETINVSAILEAAYLSAKEKREVKISELRRF